MPSETLSYTISFVMSKMTSTSNAVVLSYSVLCRQQVSAVTEEAMDRFFFFSTNTLLWFVYKPEINSKFSPSPFFYFQVNQIHEPLPQYPAWSVPAASEVRKKKKLLS